jgi:regulator of protease activity HflC (stomatin/prohibitin superfamily)
MITGIVIILGGILFSSMFVFFTVAQQSVAIIQRFGKFVRVAHSGLNLKAPWIDWVVGTVNLRVQQLDVKVETKTEDNVFVHSGICTILRSSGKGL